MCEETDTRGAFQLAERIREELGREVTAADREAILAVQRARAVMLRAERAERDAKPKQE